MSFLQSLASAFKGGSGKVPLARSFSSPWIFAETGSGQSTYEYTRSVRRAWLDNPVAQRAVRLVSEGIAGAPLASSDPKLAALIQATSAGQSLLETLAAQMLLHGNGYVQIMKDGAGRPVELFALRPERTSIVAGSDGWPTGFTYKVGDQSLTIPLCDEDASPNLIHIKDFHPADDHYGALVYDSGDMGGLTTDQFERLKGELAQAFSGQLNAGRPMVLEGGLKWQPLGLSPADMDFATLKAAAARDISLAFGVPPMLLGLPGDATYANYSEANRALWRLTLLPLATKLLAALGEGLSTWFPDASLAIDLDRVPALAEDRERLWAQVGVADFLTGAEKRSLLGLPPEPGQSENKQ